MTAPPAAATVPPAALSQLLRDAKADLVDYGALAELLEQQLQAALRHDGPRLESLAPQIVALVEQLDVRRAARVALATELLGPQQTASMSALLQRLAPAHRAPVQALWERLEQAVRDCKRRNMRNARLMTEHQALLQRVLHGDQEPLYADA